MHRNKIILWAGITYFFISLSCSLGAMNGTGAVFKEKTKISVDDNASGLIKAALTYFFENWKKDDFKKEDQERNEKLLLDLITTINKIKKSVKIKSSFYFSIIENLQNAYNQEKASSAIAYLFSKTIFLDAVTMSNVCQLAFLIKPYIAETVFLGNNNVRTYLKKQKSWIDILFCAIYEENKKLFTQALSNLGKMNFIVIDGASFFSEKFNIINYKIVISFFSSLFYLVLKKRTAFISIFLNSSFLKKCYQNAFHTKQNLCNFIDEYQKIVTGETVLEVGDLLEKKIKTWEGNKKNDSPEGESFQTDSSSECLDSEVDVVGKDDQDDIFKNPAKLQHSDGKDLKKIDSNVTV